MGRRLQDDCPSGEFIIFFIILTVGKEILRTFFQIAGWTEDQLQAQGVALVERGAKKIRVYGRTHALQPEEEITAAAIAAADNNNEGGFGELALLQPPDGLPCEGASVTLIVLSVIGGLTIAKTLYTEGKNYLIARCEENYPGGNTLHF